MSKSITRAESQSQSLVCLRQIVTQKKQTYKFQNTFPLVIDTKVLKVPKFFLYYFRYMGGTGQART